MDQSFATRKESATSLQGTEASKGFNTGKDALTVVALNLCEDPSALTSYSEAALERAMTALPALGGGRSGTLSFAHASVMDTVTVGNNTHETILSDAMVGQSREAQGELAAALHGHIATREENIAYANGLLKKQSEGTINAAEVEALKVYEKQYVNDQSGYVGVSKGAVFAIEGTIWDGEDPRMSALVVKPSPSSSEVSSALPPLPDESPTFEEELADLERAEHLRAQGPTDDVWHGKYQHQVFSPNDMVRYSYEQSVESASANVSSEPTSERGRSISLTFTHRSVMDTVTVGNKTHETILSDAMVGQSREAQGELAAALHGHIATREENIAYANGLLKKQSEGTINAAEVEALKVYEKQYVNDQSGYVGVSKGAVFAIEGTIWDGEDPRMSALVVKPSPSSSEVSSALPPLPDESPTFEEELADLERAEHLRAQAPTDDVWDGK